MADASNKSVANNKNAVPTIQITDTDLRSPSSDGKRKRASSSSRIEQIRSSSSRAASRVRDKLNEMEGKKVESPASMQDRLMNM